MSRRNIPTNTGNGGVLVGGGDGSYVSAEMLKQVDTPVETMLGIANGALSGAVISSAVSAAVTLGQSGRENFIPTVFRNITKNHLLGVLVGTTALAAFGGIVRYARAAKHNEWSDRHYAFLEQQQQGSQSAESPDDGKGRGR